MSEQTSHKNGTRKGKLTEGILTDSVEKKNMEMVKFILSPLQQCVCISPHV